MDPLSADNLTSIISDSNNVESIVQLVVTRYRHDLGFIWAGDRTLLSINSPLLLPLSSTSDAQKGEYEIRGMGLHQDALQLEPHVYELATRIYYLMTRTIQTQSIIFSGPSGAGSSTCLSLTTQQLLHLATSTKRDQRISQQITSFQSLLTAFGSAQTQCNPSASRHSTLLELHFNPSNQIYAAKALVWGLDRRRTIHLQRGERTYHAFYQLLAGATREERIELDLLDDWTDYRLLSSSGGTYRLPPGLNISDDSIAFEDLRLALRTLAFKPRHISSIYRLLSAILLLGNVQFDDPPPHLQRDHQGASLPAIVTNPDVLLRVAHLLGVPSSDLERALTTRVRWIRREMVQSILLAEGADSQRDALMSALYAILFAFIVETANHKLFPGDEAIKDMQAQGASSILLFDQPGFVDRSQAQAQAQAQAQSHSASALARKPSVAAQAAHGILLRALNGHTEFLTNYSSSLLSYYLSETLLFPDLDSSSSSSSSLLLADLSPLPSLPLPPPLAPDYAPLIELLRGGRLSGKADRKPGGILGGLAATVAKVRRGVLSEERGEADQEWLKGMREHFAGAGERQSGHFVSSPSGPGARSAFGIRHFPTTGSSGDAAAGGGEVVYDATSFVTSEWDALDPEFVALLRGSQDGFVAKLWSGPSLATETHPLDEGVIVGAQVSNAPLRRPSTIVVSTSGNKSESEEQKEDPDPTEPLLDPTKIAPLSTQLNATNSHLLALLSRTSQFLVLSLSSSPTSSSQSHSQQPPQIQTKHLRSQLVALQLPLFLARTRALGSWVHQWTFADFSDRFGGGGGGGGGGVPPARGPIEAFLREEVGLESFPLQGQGQSQSQRGGGGERAAQGEFALGKERVWVSWRGFKILEDRLRLREGPDHRQLAAQAQVQAQGQGSTPASPGAGGGGAELGPSISRSTFPGPSYAYGGGSGGYYGGGGGGGQDSVDDLLLAQRQGQGQGQSQYDPSPQPYSPYAYGSAPAPDSPRHHHPYDHGHGHHTHTHTPAGMSAPLPYVGPSGFQSDVWGEKEEFGGPLDALPRAGAGQYHFNINKESRGGGGGGGGGGVLDAEGRPKQEAAVEEVASSRGRRVWVAMVWGLTWWLPDVTLKHLGRMKRPDVRMAWREKVALCLLIGFFCGIVIFYIVVFGRLLCPNMNHAWNTKEVGYHTGTNDYWISVRGVVYDLTKFYKLQHSDILAMEVTSSDMLELAGEDLTNYFPIPLTTACPDLVTSQSITLQYANFTADLPNAIHTSGSAQVYTGSDLHKQDWYTSTFLPKMKGYKKGPLVWSPKKIKEEAESNSRMNAIVDGKVYDLTDYFYTIDLLNDNTYKFLDADLSALWQGQPGTDITSSIKELNMDPATYETNMACIETLFAQGETDFRLTPRCQVQPNMLLAFSILLMVTILAKFIAALQFGSKRMPELRDKFVICQVPCYTEGEESLRKTIDSLATLTYDDKRKLLMIICDGMIIGSGNDKATPRIVLDILGVDQDVDPDPLMFKSVAEGSKQLNYGKVWSGLYEVEGHVVPYIVIAKVGRPSERSKPGNRGKRDSQILSMRFLNRVHFDSPMYPLELEMFHQIRNVIGVDPQLYEYMLVIDADTSVAHDSLNRLVSACTDDSKIIGICGETKLENEGESWWTMIQVYEYFISHHMAKAFESMFGSVTCLPGCFTMYRLRSADKGKPLLVSSLVVDEYSDGVLDTLHKKNLLALGEDRYLTTLILKHFPNFKTKFTADAQAMTVAPNSWSILLSQRRRWINSTVHNLAELMFLPDMCGFCCFSMRFFVMIDLIGTLILPATFVYLLYLIIEVASGNTAIPTIALVMLAATYGLQAVIFLLKRQWQFIGWLVIYILAYPIYSFVLPLYSFWRFDDFSWGNTRVVVGEGKSKKILQAEEEAFDESSIPMAKFAEYQAQLDAEEMDDSKSYRSGRTHSTAGFSYQTKLPPGSFVGGPDFYRDTVHSRTGSKSTLAQFAPPASAYGAPSIRGSEFGYQGGAPPQAGSYGFMPTLQSQMSVGYAPSSASMLGGPPPPIGMGDRRQSTMSGLSYGGMGGGASVYSMGAFAPPQPSQSTSPTDEEIVVALKAYLASQDLLTITKKSTREALQTQMFPLADLAPRKDAINAMIDGVLQGRI